MSKTPTDDLYDSFKPIRNQIRQYRKLDLIISCSNKLRMLENQSPSHYKGWVPWHLLLIIKWTFESGEVNFPPKLLTENGLIKIVNLIHDLDGKHQGYFLRLGNTAGLFKYLRVMAHQQFPLQLDMGKYTLARQHLLFVRLPSDHPIKTMFRKTHGMDMDTFLMLSFILWAWFVQDGKPSLFFSKHLFKNTTFLPQTIDQYLATISLTLETAPKYLNERNQRIEKLFLQLGEETPFVRYPILKVGENYLIYSRRVFESMIQNLLYFETKKANSGRLCNEFGELLESYVENALSEMGVLYIPEKELMRQFDNSKVTDFVLPFADCTLLLEVKAVEMRPLVRVSPTNENLINELKDNVLKGVIQGYSTARNIKEENDIFNIPKRDQVFLMIVTYKDLFLGPPQDMWDEFLAEAILPELQASGIDPNLIPPERILVISIEEFDTMMKFINSSSLNFPDLLLLMVKNNKDAKSRCFTFSQHLNWDIANPETPLPYLKNEFDDLFEMTMSRVKL